MVDYIGAAEVALSAFFVVLAFVLLVRYKQASENVIASAELNHDLWRALEDRLKKQDERILDLVGRLEVVQARLESVAPVSRQAPSQPTSQPSQQSQPAPAVRPARPITAEELFPADLDTTEKTALKFLEGGAVPTTDITKRLGRSREHTARLMKTLYDRGLVERDESAKPFVYRLTDRGRRYLQAG